MLRAEAVEAIALRGSPQEKQKLLPVARRSLPRGAELNDGPHAPDAKLRSERARAWEDTKGWALRALWPDSIRAAEMFPLLESPVRGGHSEYATFLSTQVMQHLQSEDLPSALEWVKAQRDVPGEPAREHNFYIGSLCVDIMWRAWDEWDRPGVAPAFAAVAADRFERHEFHTFMRRRDGWRGWLYDIERRDSSDDPSWNDVIRDQDGKRRQLLDEMVTLAPFDAPRPYPDLSGQPLPRPDDIPHLLQRLKLLEETPDVPRQQLEFLAELIFLAWHHGKQQSDPDLIFDAWQVRDKRSDATRSTLQNQFDQYFKSIVLGSEKANLLQANWQRWHRPSHESEDDEVDAADAKKPTSQIIEAQLARSEAGESVVWHSIAHNLYFNEDGQFDHSAKKADAVTAAGGLAADGQTRQRLLDAAWRYLNEYEPQAVAKLTYRLDHRGWRAGYRALTLWYEHDRPALESLPSAIWERWIPAVVTFHVSSSIEEKRLQQRLRQRHLFFLTRQAAPEVALDFFARWLEAEIRGQWTLNSLDLIEELPPYYQKFGESRRAYQAQGLDFLFAAQWQPGDALCDTLVSKLRLKQLAPGHFKDLLLPLVQRDVAEAISYARELVAQPRRGRRQKAVFAAAVLMAEVEGGAHDLVWSALQKGQGNFGRELTSHLAYQEHHRDRDVPRWSLEQVRDFYLWLREKFPKRGDPHFDGMHSVTGREMITLFRDKQLGRLSAAKNREGCKYLEQVVAMYPQDADLHRLLHWAEEERRRVEWTPLLPQHIIRIGKESMREPRFGIVTALPHEFAAMRALLDEPHERSFPGTGAGKRYFVGSIPGSNGERHIVALALLPDTGNNIAAAIATKLLDAFPSVKHLIMCGIAGGVPHPTKPDDHVRLGDIVVSGRGGVVQYDFVKQGSQESPDEVTPNHPPRAPGSELVEGVRLLQGLAYGQHPWLPYVQVGCSALKISRPAEEEDVLHDAKGTVVDHPVKAQGEAGVPRLFLGTIASSNSVLRDPVKRDALRDQFSVKAVEMEGSGVADAEWLASREGYLVVRGACDYCDAYKNDSWHPYAAVVAAAYVRALLESMPA